MIILQARLREHTQIVEGPEREFYCFIAEDNTELKGFQKGFIIKKSKGEDFGPRQGGVCF